MTETIGYLTKADFERVVDEHNAKQTFGNEKITTNIADRLWKALVAADNAKFQALGEEHQVTPDDEVFMEETLKHYWENQLPLTREDFFKLPIVKWAEAVEFPPSDSFPLHPDAVAYVDDDQGVRWKAVWTGEKIGRVTYG